MKKKGVSCIAINPTDSAAFSNVSNQIGAHVSKTLTVSCGVTAKTTGESKLVAL